MGTSWEQRKPWICTPNGIRSLAVSPGQQPREIGFDALSHTSTGVQCRSTRWPRLTRVHVLYPRAGRSDLLEFPLLAGCGDRSDVLRPVIGGFATGCDRCCTA